MQHPNSVEEALIGAESLFFPKSVSLNTKRERDQHHRDSIDDLSLCGLLFRRQNCDAYLALFDPENDIGPSDPFFVVLFPLPNDRRVRMPKSST
jgi:hypothetical protein